LNEPFVDVGVVTWNTRDLTVANLRKLLDTDHGVSMRLLVRDNASSDGTVEALREHVPEADVDAGDENLGFAGGVNTLLARSTAPWFFLLTSDADPEPGAIRKLIEAAEAHPGAAAIAPRIERPDGTLEHSTYAFPSVGLAATLAFLWPHVSDERADELMLEGRWMHDRPREVGWAIGAALLIPRATIDTVGGLDESFFMYVEDVEWCWRARKAGRYVWFEPGARVRHIGNASGEQRYGSSRTTVHVRNAYRFYRREHGTLHNALWWLVNVIANARRLAEAIVARSSSRRRLWIEQLGAHLSAALPWRAHER
jgi:N-acetylglucosaminyl-diphospho-decaprenol L-rhamnosyltransferase